MTLNTKKRIGDLIHLVDVRNDDEKVSLLLGVTVEKRFIPSVANTIGTDMSNYKIIHKGQFACSLMQVRRDKKIPVALLKDYDKAIVTSAYPVFEVNDEDEILPEYLMMWFSRKEFDRESCFYAVGGVRGSLEREDFCNMELPVPSLPEQQKLVNEYNTIQKRININSSMIENLENTAQSIYKQRFIDFEFPDNEGKPYKSNGGEMVYCEDLEKDIPKDFVCNKIGEKINVIRGVNYSVDDELMEKDENSVLLLKSNNIQNGNLNLDEPVIIDKSLISDEQRLTKGCVLMTLSSGSFSHVGKATIIYEDIPYVFGAFCAKIVFEEPYGNYLSLYFKNKAFKDFIISNILGTNINNLTKEYVCDILLPLPNEELLIGFNKLINPIIHHLGILRNENLKLDLLRETHLSLLMNRNKNE